MGSFDRLGLFDSFVQPPTNPILIQLDINAVRVNLDATMRDHRSASNTRMLWVYVSPDGDLGLDWSMANRAPWMHLYGRQNWRRRAKAQLQAEALCAMCAECGLVVPAEIVDHKKPHHGDPFEFVYGPLQSLCRRRHNADKEFEERRGFRRDIGLDGMPRPCSSSIPAIDHSAVYSLKSASLIRRVYRPRCVLLLRKRVDLACRRYRARYCWTSGFDPSELPDARRHARIGPSWLRTTHAQRLDAGRKQWNLPVANFCIWVRALPRCQLCPE
jgi:5-methylcytosine-specific restriction protein A